MFLNVFLSKQDLNNRIHNHKSYLNLDGTCAATPRRQMQQLAAPGSEGISEKLQLTLH